MPRVTTPSCFATFLTSPKFLGQTSEKYVFRCLTVPVFKFTFKVSDSNGLVNFDPHFWGQRNLTTSTLFISRVMRRIWYKQRRNYGNNNPCHLIYHQSNNGFWRDSLLCIFSWISKWFPSTEKLGNFAPVSKVLQSFAMDCRGGSCSNLEKFTKPYFALPSGGWCFGQCKIFPRYTFAQFCLALPLSSVLHIFATALHNCAMYLHRIEMMHSIREVGVQFPDVQQICWSFLAAPANPSLESSTWGHLTVRTRVLSALDMVLSELDATHCSVPTSSSTQRARISFEGSWIGTRYQVLSNGYHMHVLQTSDWKA